MTYTLGDLIRDVYIEMGEMIVTTATGGSTTTAIDTKLTGLVSDDVYIDGFLHVISADGSAPEDEFARISENTDDGAEVTFTIATLTAAIASGDKFGFARKTYPLFQVIEQINAGLRMLGDLILVDTTIMDTASSQTEYTWEIAWKRRKPLRIDIQGIASDSNNNRWQQIFNWEVIPAAPGSTGLIVFGKQPIASRDVRIWYKDPHPRINDYDDPVDESITPELAVMASLVKIANWNLISSGVDDPDARAFVNNAKVEYQIAKSNHPIVRPKNTLPGLTVA